MAITGSRRKNKHAIRKSKYGTRGTKYIRRKNKHAKKYKFKLLALSSPFIVKSKQSLIRRITELAISLILWFYMLMVMYFFISACFNYNDSFLRILKSYFRVTNNDIRYFITISVMYFCLSFLLLLIWKVYNKKRFGALKRRKPPELTSNEDMLSLALIEPGIHKILQTEKIIIFDENPVRELSRRE